MNDLKPQKIKEIFENFLKDNSTDNKLNDLEKLVYECIETNKKLWDLEDLARMHELGNDSVANAKKEIDKTNHKRNHIMRDIDAILNEVLKNKEGEDIEKMYSESPGTVIDRISILSIKKHMIEKFVDLIENEESKKEYQKNIEILEDRINSLIKFLDIYFKKIESNKKFFKINEPIKVYNDERVKKYINSSK